LKYEAIIFDVSDTLIEYTPNYAKIYGDRLRSLGFEVSEEKAQEISRVINLAIGEQTQKEQCGEPRISKEAYNSLLDNAALNCVINKGNCLKKHLTDLSVVEVPVQKMTIIAGVIETLDILKKNYRLAIVSNHYAWLMNYLQESGLAPYFESIVISDIVGVAKPNIRIMEIVLEGLNLKAENCLYVGDQPFDVLCSKQAGMDCAWIVADKIDLPKSIPFKEDYRIGKLPDLLNVL
jgi:HAD superfamily hydrolase (TIGR01509 family)